MGTTLRVFAHPTVTEWKGRYPVAMNFDDVGLQDRVIGHMVVTNRWPAEDFAGLCALYEGAKTALLETMKDVLPLPINYNFR